MLNLIIESRWGFDTYLCVMFIVLPNALYCTA